MECLTAGFGMGPGGSTPLLPLETFISALFRRIKDL
jgi:hypothetical protein